jgi:hypothetical protein
MKQSDVHIGQHYIAKVTNKLVTVEILAESPHGGWDAKNLDTGKNVRIKSAQRLRGTASKSPKTPTAATPAAASNPPAKAASPDTAAPVQRTRGTKRTSALDAAARVLAEAGEPMNCRQLIERMAEANLWASSAATPVNTLSAAIAKEIRVKGDASRFAKVDRGQFALQPNP